MVVLHESSDEVLPWLLGRTMLGFSTIRHKVLGLKPTVPAEYLEGSLRNIYLAVPQQHVFIVSVWMMAGSTSLY
jgi:hypothetical protein